MKRDNGKEKSNKGALNELNKALIKEVGKFGKGRATKVQELIDEVLNVLNAIFNSSFDRFMGTSQYLAVKTKFKNIIS